MASAAETTAAENDESVSSSLETALGTLREDFARAAVRLTDPHAVMPDGYALSQFSDAVTKAKARVLRAYSDDRHAGLRSYVNASFPEPVVENITSHGVVLVRTESAEAYIRILTAFIEKLRNVSPLSIDLAVESWPTAASIMICNFEYPGCVDVSIAVATGSTNTRLKSFYRGLYWYRIERTGYKAVTGALNLVDRSGRTLRCQLVADGAGEGALPCNLE